MHFWCLPQRLDEAACAEGQLSSWLNDELLISQKLLLLTSSLFTPIAIPPRDDGMTGRRSPRWRLARPHARLFCVGLLERYHNKRPYFLGKKQHNKPDEGFINRSVLGVPHFNHHSSLSNRIYCGPLCTVSLPLEMSKDAPLLSLGCGEEPWSMQNCSCRSGWGGGARAAD